MKKILNQISQLSSQSVVDAMSILHWPQTMIHGSRPLFPGRKMCGFAVTLRFVLFREDLLEDLPKGSASAEYRAFELCDPEKVLVASSVGPWESIGGDIKFLRLYQKKVAGIVTDGSIRDSNSIRDYQIPVYAHSSTAKQGPGVMLPWSVNEPINCGGILVREGDIILGDDDGVVVLPQKISSEVIDIANKRIKIEEVVKNELKVNPTSPGKYYPFNDKTEELYNQKKKNKKKSSNL
tara:strand:+ start:16715 stop:17425 length:711 start_codon:yes stop_codon:yes gene_type:complete